MALLLRLGSLAAPAGPRERGEASRAFCLDLPKEVSFQRLEQTVPADGFDWQRAFERREYKGDDFMHEHRRAMPPKHTLREPTEDEDAAALHAMLRELATRPLHDLETAVIVPVVPSYGVGATINSMVYPVLEALSQNATLFAPSMRNWTSPTCETRDLSCYFDSLPSLRAHAMRIHEKQHGSRNMPAHKMMMMQRLQEPMLHNDTKSTVCGEIQSLGLDCPRMLTLHRLKRELLSMLLADGGDDSGRMHRLRHRKLRGASQLQAEGIEAQAAAPVPRPDMTIGGVSLSKVFEYTDRLREQKRRRQRDPDLSWLRSAMAKPLGLARGRFNLTALSLYDESSFLSKIDPRWTKRGRFWLFSQIIKFITTPNSRLKAKMERHRADMEARLGPVEKPVLGLHVRKGDACGDRGECRSIKDYMPIITEMIHKYGYKTVFLATPDPGVLAEVKNYPNVSFRYLPTTNTTELMKAKGIRKIDVAIEKGVVDAGAEFDEALISAYMLSEADGFIGGFSSNAARIAYSLMAAGPKGCVKPYDSYDFNWCAAFGKGGGSVLRVENRTCQEAQDGGEYALPCEISC